MHVALTDILVCPRCGPPHALILLADSVQDRRLLEGVLGCANCHERYPVRGGFADLRWSGVEAAGDEGGSAGVPTAGDEGGPGDVAGEGNADAERLAALIGLDASAGRSFALVAGRGAAAAAAMAALVEGVELVAIDGSEGGGGEELHGVSRIAVSGKLPFADRSLRGVALTAGSDRALLEEAARVLHPMGRLLVEDAPPDVEARLGAVGLRIVAREGGTVVGVVG